jgi:hypothetical protein
VAPNEEAEEEEEEEGRQNTITLDDGKRTKEKSTMDLSLWGFNLYYYCYYYLSSKHHS